MAFTELAAIELTPEEQFVSQVSQAPLLTAEDERSLALKIRQGRLVKGAVAILSQSGVAPTPANIIRGLAQTFDTPIAQAWFQVTGLTDLREAHDTLMALGQQWSHGERPNAANNPYLGAVKEVVSLLQKDGAKKDEVEEASLDIGAAGNILNGLPKEKGKQKGYFQALYREGNWARSIFTQSNLLLVLKVASKYQGRGLDRLELMQEGYKGLARAVEGFNPYLGGKFSSYAYRAIVQDVKRGRWRLNARLVVPLPYLEQLKALSKVTNNLAVELRREPTDEEIRAAMGITVDNLEGLQLATELRVASLDNPPEDGYPLAELVPDRDAGPEELVLANLRSDEIKILVRKMLRRLPKEERGVIRMYYMRGMTFAEIGWKEGYSRETARQRYNRGMGTLLALAQNGYRERIMEALEEV